MSSREPSSQLGDTRPDFCAEGCPPPAPKRSPHAIADETGKLKITAVLWSSKCSQLKMSSPFLLSLFPSFLFPKNNSDSFFTAYITKIIFKCDSFPMKHIFGFGQVTFPLKHALEHHIFK